MSPQAAFSKYIARRILADNASRVAFARSPMIVPVCLDVLDRIDG